MHDYDADDLVFAMLTPPTRPGPCKAATAPEVDPVERRLERSAESSLYTYTYRRANGETGIATAIEVRHGSGKVKV